MAEHNLNDRLRKGLAGWDPVRIENSVGHGTPDINYIGGWIESKWLPRWPKRADTVVRLDHYTKQQRAWHTRRCAAGGRVHVVIEVEHDVFVFDGAKAAVGLGFWTREEMQQNALLVMSPWDRATFRKFINTCDNDRAG